jgi:hypothetical protein
MPEASSLHTLATQGKAVAVRTALQASPRRVKQLLMAVDDLGRIPLHLAARHLDPSAAKEMLEAGGERLAVEQLHAKSKGWRVVSPQCWGVPDRPVVADVYGCLPVHRAAYAGSWEAVKLFVSIGKSWRRNSRFVHSHGMTPQVPPFWTL